MFPTPEVENVRRYSAWQKGAHRAFSIPFAWWRASFSSRTRPQANVLIFTDNRPLLTAFREGDRSALAQVYRRYVRDVVRIARQGFVLGPTKVPGLRNPEDQNDLSQEVFLKAFGESARLSYDGVRPYGPFLWRIARNTMIDRARKAGREVPTDFSGAMLEAAPQESTVEDDLDFKRLRKETVDFIATQDEETQRFVVLRFEEGRSQYEVLKIMGITRRRVRTLEQRTLDALRRHLKKKGLEGSSGPNGHPERTEP